VPRKRQQLEAESQAAAESHVADFVVVVDPVIRHFDDEAGSARDREIAVDATEESVVRLGLVSALLHGNGGVAQRAALAVESDAGEECG